MTPEAQCRTGVTRPVPGPSHHGRARPEAAGPSRGLHGPPSHRPPPLCPGPCSSFCLAGPHHPSHPGVGPPLPSPRPSSEAPTDFAQQPPGVVPSSRRSGPSGVSSQLPGGCRRPQVLCPTRRPPVGASASLLADTASAGAARLGPGPEGSLGKEDVGAVGKEGKEGAREGAPAGPPCAGQGQASGGMAGLPWANRDMSGPPSLSFFLPTTRGLSPLPVPPRWTGRPDPAGL